MKRIGWRQRWCRRGAMMLVAVGMAVAAVGCGSGQTATDPTKETTGASDAAAASGASSAAATASGSAKAGQLEPISIVLDWYPNAIHAFLYIAQERGYFAEEGLKVDIQFPANPNDGISLPAAGKADLGLYYPADIILARGNEHVPLKVVGSLTQDPLAVVVSLKEKNILSPDDLSGKTVAFASTPLAELTLKSLHKKDGTLLTDLKMQDVGFDLLTALTTGRADAAAGCMVNHEVPVMEEQGLPVNYFYPTDYGVPPCYEMVFVTGEQTAVEKKAQLQGFMRAIRRGFEDMKADPKGAVDLLLTHQEADAFPLTQSVEMKSIEALLPAMEKPDAPFLTQKAEVWQNTIDWLYENQLLKERIDPESFLVDLGA